jgi:small-conductance mechanosensitive channel
MSRCVALSLALALWLLCAFEAFAFDPSILGQADRSVAALRQDLARVQSDLQLLNLPADRIAAVRRELDDIRSRALAGSESLKAPIAEVTQQLNSLGPAPAAGDSEAEAIRDRRATLTGSLSRLHAAEKQLDLIMIESEQLIDRAATAQRDQFFRRIFEPSRSILNPTLWYEGGRGFGVLIARLGNLLAGWWADISGVANFVLLILAPILLAIVIRLFHWGRRWLIVRYGPLVRMRRAPDDTDRLWRIVRGTLLAFLAAAALIFILYVTFRAAQVLTPRFEQLFSALADFVVFTIVMAVAARLIAASGEPQWRIIDADDRAASRFAVLAMLAAIVLQVESFFTELSGILYLPVTFSVAQSAFSALLIIVLIGAIIVVLRNQAGLGEERRGNLYFNWVSPLVPIIWLVLGIAAGALLLGYVALAGFIAEQLVTTAFLIAGLLLVHHLSESVVAASLDSKSRIGQALRRITGLGARGTARLGLFLRTIIDIALIFVGLPLLLLNWTVNWIDFGSWVNAALVGFKIGNVTVSLANILVVVAVVIAGIAVTKLVTRWLDSRVLAQTALDRGVRDSVRKGVSYAGYVVAAGFALSAAGLDFSSLAIIAGALGVGIGFGLQSIVNNFISGLILLAERPVRVGDWIQLTAGEGIIRRMNVRSTEIETFDNCTIIVPNSSLITEAVRNWTHHDTIGRFRVTLTVPYDSDAQFIRETMLKLAKEHTLVLHLPEPRVFLNSLGTTSLEFELRAFVGDVLNAAEVASDIRFALLAAVKEKRIGIAKTPIHDIRIIDGGPLQARAES